MDSGRSTRALPRVSFLIRRSRDQRSVSTSPGLIAAAHVLHRLLAPRHPPCALVLLIRKEHVRCRYGVFKVRASSKGPPYTRPRPSGARSLKTQQRAAGSRGNRRVKRGRRLLGELDHRTTRARARAINESSSLRSKSSGFPRKEVIQPHLPVRLPCYDFTPIIDPTFDGCLPKGVSPPASGVADFRGVTGGVYKARERIHRGVADPRLLATPPSWRRVAASNPNRDRLFGIRSTSRYCSPLYRPM